MRRFPLARHPIELKPTDAADPFWRCEFEKSAIGLEGILFEGKPLSAGLSAPTGRASQASHAGRIEIAVVIVFD